MNIPDDPASGSNLTVGPVEAEVQAPAALVYQLLSAIGQGPTRGGESARILERDGERLVCEFATLVPLPVAGVQLVRTREVVVLRPPDTVTYDHLDGPIRGLRETITVLPIDVGRCRLVYRAAYRPRSVLARLGLCIARPIIERTMREHFADLRSRAESRAARSRVFRTEPTGAPTP